MKVIAVFDFKHNPSCRITETKEIVEGGIYTVISEETGFCYHAGMVITGYGLDGFAALYDSRIFIPLSEISEVEKNEIKNTI